MAGFDITKVITATDIVSAVSAGIIAYVTYKTAQEDQPSAQQEQPQGQPQVGSASTAQPEQPDVNPSPAASPSSTPSGGAAGRIDKFRNILNNPNSSPSMRLHAKMNLDKLEPNVNHALSNVAKSLSPKQE